MLNDNVRVFALVTVIPSALIILGNYLCKKFGGGKLNSRQGAEKKQDRRKSSAPVCKSMDPEIERRQMTQKVKVRIFLLN
jgi:hypothetical protein